MSNNVRICKLCKNTMSYSAFYMCNSCLRELDQVSAYIKKHPYAPLEEISQETSLTLDCVERIIEFFRQSNTSMKHWNVRKLFIFNKCIDFLFLPIYNDEVFKKRKGGHENGKRNCKRNWIQLYISCDLW